MLGLGYSLAHLSVVQDNTLVVARERGEENEVVNVAMRGNQVIPTVTSEKTRSVSHT